MADWIRFKLAPTGRTQTAPGHPGGECELDFSEIMYVQQVGEGRNLSAVSVVTKAGANMIFNSTHARQFLHVWEDYRRRLDIEIKEAPAESDPVIQPVNGVIR
jgi:hypothetical protein